MRKFNSKLHFDQNAEWKKFGGGRTVGLDDIQILMNSIRQMQDLIPPLVPHLLKHVPGITDQDVQHIALLQSGNCSQHLIERVQGIVARCRIWASQIFDKNQAYRYYYK